MGGGLGAEVLVSFSAPGISEGALSKGVGAMGSFLTPSHISFSMLKRSPSSTMGTRHLQSSCTAQQNTSGEAPAQTAHL